MTDSTLYRADLDTVASATRREWLVTNGLGGFAAGTVGGARTRRYHGLLVAALNPPVQRVVTLAACDIVVIYAGKRFALGCHEYADGTVDPHGYRYLQSFSLDGTLPVWTWVLDDAVLVQRFWMPHGRNAAFLKLTVERASGPVALEIQPLCTGRDYHAHGQGGWQPDVDVENRGVRIGGFHDVPPYRIVCEPGNFEPAPAWHWNFRHRVETERGLDNREDLFRPGIFRVELQPTESATLSCRIDNGAAHATDTLDVERARQQALLRDLPEGTPTWIRRLALAADQFIVQRTTTDGSGMTVVAGYPWFTDWGRDTMIALPGLALATGRHDVAASVLRTFAAHLSEGMLPNRFPDGGDEPEYNTVDATLWFFHAVQTYLAQTGDAQLADELYPALVDVLDWHRRGTRYRIQADSDDGLLYAGEPGVQLTWMDAKVGDWVVTPRIGKPVEINALWYNALVFVRDLAAGRNDTLGSRNFDTLATRVRQSFRARYFNPDRGCLFDVVDGPDGDDASVRPNQIFAASLPHRALSNGQLRQVVDTCARSLVTPVGLRSLAPDDPAYVGRYEGGPWQRDGAYHQGTVWSWLLGPFALAHYAVYRNRNAALAWLEPLAGHLDDAGMGSVSEIFDGDPPHTPRGCFAQAWSVAEILRAWIELSSRAVQKTTRVKRA